MTTPDQLSPERAIPEPALREWRVELMNDAGETQTLLREGWDDQDQLNEYALQQAMDRHGARSDTRRDDAESTDRDQATDGHSDAADQ